MATTEEQKKAILPFLQRADEIGKVEPKVAYYCRLYAIQQGLALENRSAQIEGVLKALLSKLEKERAAIALGDTDSQYCENFAITVFSRADKADRAGRADKNTAMTFYAASIFFEILNQFSPIEADLADMQRYAAWKAADIRKALREGRTPTPGAPNDDPLNSASTSGDAELPPAPHFPLPPPFVPDSIDTPGAATSTPTSTQAPRFRAGSRVLVDDREHGTGRAVKGTVAKLNSEFVDDGYTVALSDRIVDVAESALAPDLEPGDAVQYTAAPGETVSANVVEVAAASWPPSYQLLTTGGLQVTGLPHQLTVTEQQKGIDKPDSAQMQQQPAGTGSNSTADEQPNPFLVQSSMPSPPPPPPPFLSPGAPQQAYSHAGESAARLPSTSEHSDMSQALLFNTAALQSNLTAAQRGDDIATAAELDELSSAEARGTPQQFPAAAPNHVAASGPALQPSPHPSVQPPPSPSVPPPPPPSVQQSAPPQYPALSGSITQAAFGFEPSMSAVSEAQKLARYAASSLGFEDVPTAVKQLSEALKLLTQPQTISTDSKQWK